MAYNADTGTIYSKIIRVASPENVENHRIRYEMTKLQLS